MSYIPPDIIDKIHDAANMEDIIRDHVDLRKSGSSLEGHCPDCQDTSKKKRSFSFSPAKQVAKCFKCEKSASSAVNFLTTFLDMSFPDALRELAHRYGITIPQSSAKPKKSESFRDQQLTASGIDLNTKRYTSGSVNRAFEVKGGQDMIIHYRTLDGDTLTFANKNRKGKIQPYVRVRHKIPSHHPDKNGKAIRYASPTGSGSQLFIPDVIIDAYADSAAIDTLTICEGEKKATKLCQHGVYAVGISGIHNFDPTEMTHVFSDLLERCQVKHVVFLLDTDWKDISIKEDVNVETRPRSFASAVIKFRHYFYAYLKDDINLKILFGHHQSDIHKGIDDYAHTMVKPQDLAPALKDSVYNADGLSDHFRLYNITSANDYKIKDFWHLNNKADFLQHYQSDLKEVDTRFLHGSIYMRWDDEQDEFVIDQELMPHEQFWKLEANSRNKMQHKISFAGCRNFLKSRGIFKVLVPGQSLRFVKKENNILEEVDDQYIRDYAIELAESLNMPDVYELLLSSDRAFSSTKLRDMYPVDFKPIGSDKNHQVLVFNNTAVRITKDSIKQVPLASLGGCAWKDEIIDRSLEFDEPLFQLVEENGALALDIPEKHQQTLMESHIFRFLFNTSNFHWRKQFTKKKDANGKYRRLSSPPAYTEAEQADHMQHLTSKLIAIGSILHNYEDLSNTKAIVCMDGVESEVGKNEGGTGKSIFSTMFEFILNSFIIDAQDKRLTDDGFLFDGIDERTRVVVLDDCRVNLNFKWFYSKITRGLYVNPKGQKKFFAGIKKWIFNTNHSLGGMDNSTRRRQYTLAFSDWYGDHRSPVDDFDCMLFREWDAKQWNLLFNVFFCSLQGFLKYRFKYGVPDENIRKRQLRQNIGEEVLEWCLDYFGTSEKPNNKHINIKIGRTEINEELYSAHPHIKKYITPRYVKERIYYFCDYAGFKYNQRHDKKHRIKSGAEEFIVVADDHCPDNPPKIADVNTGKENNPNEAPTPF